MNEFRTQPLRHFDVRLTTTGEVFINPTKLYKGSYGFITLRCFVPITQNYVEGVTVPVVKVSRAITNKFGETVSDGNAYAMFFVEKVNIGGYDYSCNECLMPKPFTAIAGDLKMSFSYYEGVVDEDRGITHDNLLTSAIVEATVENGGIIADTLDVPQGDEWIAQINTVITNVNNLTVERGTRVTENGEFVEEFDTPVMSGKGESSIVQVKPRDKIDPETGEINQYNQSQAIGSSSIALGVDSQALGARSLTLGTSNIAGGAHSVVTGGANKALGHTSFASGNQSYAYGQYSSVFGQLCRAGEEDKVDDSDVGYSATAFGVGSNALGKMGFAINHASRAAGRGSFASGYKSKANGEYSIAGGSESVADGNYSIAIGRKSEASGTNAIAGGVKGKASGDYATAIGNDVQASGESSVAIGEGTVAGGKMSLAGGYTAKAYGTASISFGTGVVGVEGDTSAGKYSGSFGQANTVAGGSAFALGQGLQVDGNTQTAVGKYNTPDIEQAFIVGGGSSKDARKNLFTVDKQGNVVAVGRMTSNEAPENETDVARLKELNELKQEIGSGWHDIPFVVINNGDGTYSYEAQLPDIPDRNKHYMLNLMVKGLPYMGLDRYDLVRSDGSVCIENFVAVYNIDYNNDALGEQYYPCILGYGEYYTLLTQVDGNIVTTIPNNQFSDWAMASTYGFKVKLHTYPEWSDDGSYNPVVMLRYKLEEIQE